MPVFTKPDIWQVGLLAAERLAVEGPLICDQTVVPEVADAAMVAVVEQVDWSGPAFADTEPEPTVMLTWSLETQDPFVVVHWNT